MPSINFYSTVSKGDCGH